MLVLERVFTEQIAAPIRRQVLEAVTTQKLIAGAWVDKDNNGCIMAVAGHAAVNEKLTYGKFSRYREPGTIVAGMLGIDISWVSLAFREWDNLSDEKQKEFIEFLRLELAAMGPEDVPAEAAVAVRQDGFRNLTSVFSAFLVFFAFLHV